MLFRSRGLFWAFQCVAYDLLLKAAWQTIDRFSSRDPSLNGRCGARAVLHTHKRNLNYHPHVHLIMSGAALNAATKQRKQRGSKEKFLLFPVLALARLLRAKWFVAMEATGLKCNETLPQYWVVYCKKSGEGW